MAASTEGVIALVALWLLITVASIAIAVAVLIRLPADYLRRRSARRDRWSVLGAYARNVVGIALVAVGALLAIPGVPGQGVLVALAGILLLDFRGKRRVVAKMLAQPSLLLAINSLRRRFLQPPIERPDPSP